MLGAYTDCCELNRQEITFQKYFRENVRIDLLLATRRY